MKKRCGIRLGIKLFLLGIVVSLAGLGGAALAQGNQARMSVEPPTEQVKMGGPEFTVNIVADGVTNLAAFQFTLSYDRSILNYLSVKEGDFLGSTGRQPHCGESKVEGDNPGVVRFNCATLNAPVSLGGPAGANGSGLLAQVTFAPIGGGTTSLELTDVILAAAEIDARGSPTQMDTVVQGASLEVASSGGGSSWALWAAIAGVVAVIVVVGAIVLVVRARGGRSSGSLGGL